MTTVYDGFKTAISNAANDTAETIRSTLWSLFGKLGEHGGGYFVLNSSLQWIFLIN